jgi:hypothetical protein
LDKYIEEGVKMAFLGLQIDNHLNWKTRIEQLIPKLSRACYAVRFTLHISNIDTLKTIYFDYFHSLMKYGIILGGGGVIQPTAKSYLHYKRKFSES